MIIYVNAAAGRDGNGTKERPFRFINDAAQAAHPGDEVLVAPGGLPGICQSPARRQKKRADHLPEHRTAGRSHHRSGRDQKLETL